LQCIKSISYSQQNNFIMSEKRYFVLSPSHHKKPRAMFSCAPFSSGSEWASTINNDTLFYTLAQARELAKQTPIGLYFVEHTETIFNTYANTAKIKFGDFMAYANDFCYEVIRDLPQTQAAPEVQDEATRKTQAQKNQDAHCNAILEDLGYIAITPTPEEKREYILYRYFGDGTGEKRYFCAEEEPSNYYCFVGEQKADLFTEKEAQKLNNELPAGWYHCHYEVFNGKLPTPEAAPAPKKRVGYVLYTKSNKEAQKIYAQYKTDSIFTRISGIIADAYRTPEEAQFAADILNGKGDTNFGWKVEQVEF
jgi:hypothetical protein